MALGCASSILGGTGLALVAILVVATVVLFKRKSRN
jgi:hypothetical protein